MLLGLEYLLKTEQETVNITRGYLRGFHENLPSIIDTLFKLPYFTGELPDVETPEGSFLSICKVTYMQIPYTFWSLYNQYEKGYYLESIILYRHLLEAFIQLRYFHKYPTKFADHISQNKRVNFSVMFNEFSPGFYKPYYKSQLSEAAHGFIFKYTNRVNRDSLGTRTVMGSEFNVDRATYTMNMTIPLVYGYLNWFLKFFINNDLDRDTSEMIRNSINWLDYAMKSHKKSNPLSERWYEHMDKYIL